MSTAFILGLVLAGGESRRMGQDKALLSVAGYPSLLHRQLALLQSLSLDACSVSRHRRHQTPTDLDVPVLSDSNSDNHEGPLAGIQAAALAWPEATAVLVLPVDLPFVCTASLQHLLEEGQRLRTAVYYENEYLPLYLPLHDALREDLCARITLAASDKSIRGLLRRENAVALPAPVDNTLTNTNTPEEWQASLQADWSVLPQD
ncbi:MULTISPECIES: molybdenum cofactor guanylyltransferase [Oceanospirillaceae]|uniref:Molybdenum cofactor guanylyltransferase n=1 Tax=Oceanobacter antarcticus TaxID=3133425 RepID=A0ABW8NNR5_9GAMM